MTRTPLRLALGWLALIALAAPPAAAQSNPVTVHALAMHGEPKYGPDFQHLDYVDPDAPKGGAVTLGAFGSFDSLNPYVVQGDAAAGLGFLNETLTTGTGDEAFSEYGLLAESITVPEDRSWVEFTLRPEARWNDGQPVTPDDVVWTFNTLLDKGAPFYKAYYADVASAEKTGERGVRFTFKRAGNRELPLIMGQMPVLPKHYWEGREFGPTLEPPLGSGPYRIKSFDPGRSITYERVPDWWGANLPINRGRYNFDQITYEYYRDADVMLDAFKSGRMDFRSENSAKNWATAYDIPAVRNGQLVKELIQNQDPQGMQGFFMNTRRAKFQDRRVRQALNLLFDFEWLNANIFYNQYTRTKSYFANSELAATGLPSPEELAILEPYRGRIPDEVFTTEFNPPVTDGSGNIRQNLRAALDLFRQAGWEIRGGALTNTQTGEPFALEILLDDQTFERVAQPYVANLKRAGIQATLRTVDTAQYKNRTDAFDYDMIIATVAESLSPGNEQREFWGSAAADARGSSNFAGVRDPVVDELINLIVTAPDRDSLITRTRALDRVLLWGYYVVPHWHITAYRVAYWNRFTHPQVAPKYGLAFIDTWWIDPQKDAALQASHARAG